MADAVALFRPLRPEALTPFLDLDDDSEDGEGIYAEPLEDGSFFLHTFQPFELFSEDLVVAQTWLAQFGEALGEVHHDDRGLLFFPDTVEPEGVSYDEVVAEVGDAGVWMPLLDPAAFAAAAALFGGGEHDEGDENHGAGAPPGFDIQALQNMAAQFFGTAPDGTVNAPSSFEIAKLLEGAQAQLLASLGMEMPAGGASGAGAAGAHDAPITVAAGNDEGGDDAEEAGDEAPGAAGAPRKPSKPR